MVTYHLSGERNRNTLCVSACLCWLRGAPVGLSALLCQAALSQLLQNDLSPFHCSQNAEANQEEDQQVVCKYSTWAVTQQRGRGDFDFFQLIFVLPAEHNDNDQVAHIAVQTTVNTSGP